MNIIEKLNKLNEESQALVSDDEYLNLELLGEFNFFNVKTVRSIYRNIYRIACEEMIDKYGLTDTVSYDVGNNGSSRIKIVIKGLKCIYVKTVDCCYEMVNYNTILSSARGILRPIFESSCEKSE